MIAGVDPGFKGAIAILAANKDIMDIVKMPILKVGDKKELDEQLIRRIFANSKLTHVYIEKSQTMPKQGLVSSGRYMCGYGILRGICVGLGIPYTLIKPTSWKGALMRDMPKEKQASIARALQLYPNLELDRKKDDGKADALLIGLYGLRHGG